MELDYYRVAFRKKGKHALLTDAVTPFKAIRNNWRYWVADPFVFEYDGETYIFAELFDYLRRRGVIGYSKLGSNGNFSRWKEIIVEPYHMSYPQIFEYDGEIYIVPETGSGRTLDMYRAVDFPDKWEKSVNLAKDVFFALTTLLNRGGKLYALACDMERTKNSELVLFGVNENMKLCSTELGCVVNDPVTARAAGEMIEYGGKLMRVSQESSEEYGKRLNFLEVDSDFSSYYREKTVKTVDVKDLNIIGIKKPLRVHTYNSSENYEVIDVYSANKSLLNLFGRLAYLLYKKLRG